MTQANRKATPTVRAYRRLLSGRSGGQSGNRHEMISAETVKEPECENRDAQHEGGIITVGRLDSRKVLGFQGSRVPKFKRIKNRRTLNLEP